MKRNLKFFQNFAWILFILFICLSLFDIRFGTLGLFCMISPIFFSSIGKGRLHCSYYCPRGSFLGKFLYTISLGYPIPSFIRNKYFKNIVLGFILTVLTTSLYTGGFTLINIGTTLFKIVLFTTILGIVLGIIYTPRIWCMFCPMGYTAELIDRKVRSHNK